MTDREYLELAAKAAGIELWHEEVFTNGLTRKVSDNGILQWNPLTDDGDALRLAVKLRMDILFDADDVEAIATQHSRVEDGEVISPWAWESLGDDPYAATRRAIVRAAAEIGRSME